MDIFIKYNCKKSIINTYNYQSIKSIIYHYLETNNINDRVENYFLDYNGTTLNEDYSLEKYNINNKTLLTLNKKIKGGSNNRFLIIFIGLIIGIIPIFILPLGFIPLTAGLIKIIVEKSLNTVCKYLVCTLGKVTLYSRIKIFLWIIKYTAFILMIYVLITFPLMLFCVSLKGHTILDNPKSMCGALQAGSLTGIIITIIFLMIYACFKFGDYIINFFIYIFKHFYITNTLFNPYLQSALKIYDRVKYLPIFAIPYLGEVSVAYFKSLGVLLNSVNLFLNNIKKVGCQITLDDKSLLKGISSLEKYHSKKKTTSSDKEESSNKKSTSSDNGHSTTPTFSVNNIICEPDLDKCCSPENYVFIGDTLAKLLDNPVTSSIIKNFKVYPAFVLMVEALYGAGLDRLGFNSGLNGSLDEQKNYLKRLLEKNIGKLSESTVNLIKIFLSNGDQQLIIDIKNEIDKDLDITVNQKKEEEADQIKTKIDELEEQMIIYSKKEGAAYVIGGSLFKTIFKFIFVNVFCNVMTTAKTSENIISQMGDISDMLDMLKAGSSTGICISFIYIIAVIVLLICGLLGFF